MIAESFGARALRQGSGEAAGVEGGAARLLHLGQVLHRQEGAVGDATPSMSWDAIEQAAMGGEESLVFFHGVWRVTDQMKALQAQRQGRLLPQIHVDQRARPGKKGGKPSNLSHPIAYAVSAKSKNKELAAFIVGSPSQPVPNLQHAVSTNHTPINYGEQSMPEILDKGWALVAATPMLKYASFMPNHPKIGQYNSIIFKGIQGVETGRLTAAAADRLRGRRADQRARQGRDDPQRASACRRARRGIGARRGGEPRLARFRPRAVAPPAHQLRAVPRAGADPAARASSSRR